MIKTKKHGNKKKSPYLTFLLVIAIFSTAPQPVIGKPFCSLRDPTQQIFNFFPHATNYKSIIHNIDNETKKELSEQLDFTIHSKEIGRHTVFFALKNETPLGLIHVRTEPGIWGLTEIVWALDMELNIIDFNFQRCRGSSCRAIQSNNFKEQLKGKNLNGVLGLLKTSNEFTYSSRVNAPSLAEKSLAKSILRSAVKTMIITNKIWHEDIAELNIINKPDI
jgi:hypothetical protein